MKQFFLLAMLILLTGGSRSAAQEPVKTRIMLLGDSLTAQNEGRLPLYKKLTSEGYLFEFVGSQGQPPNRHEGHGGFTIGPDGSKPGNLSDNVEGWIREAHPDVIFLLVGNNDFNGKAGVDPKGAPVRLEALVEKIAALVPQADVIVSTGLKIAFVDDYAGALNREIPRIVADFQQKGRKVHLADLNAEVDLIKGSPPFDKPGGDYLDGTHLNAVGGQKLADARFAHLIPFLKKAGN